MFWSAALDLKTQRPPPRPSYGSFNRTTNAASSFRIPQSIPEHQPVSRFTSPIRARVEEYFERPATAVARTRASLQLSEHTQVALKLLLQGERDARPKASSTAVSRTPTRALDMNKIRNYSARRTPMKDLPERTPLLKPLARVDDQEDFKPQENINEHNYWMQELEKRRAGIKTSRRRTCTSMSDRATTSPLKVGVVMCSVPLVLVLGFVLFVMLFGDGLNVSTNVTSAMNNLLGFGEDAGSMATRHPTDRIAKAFALPPEKYQLENESLVAVSTDQTKLRGSLKENAGRY